MRTRIGGSLCGDLAGNGCARSRSNLAGKMQTDHEPVSARASRLRRPDVISYKHHNSALYQQPDREGKGPQFSYDARETRAKVRNRASETSAVCTFSHDSFGKTGSCATINKNSITPPPPNHL